MVSWEGVSLLLSPLPVPYPTLPGSRPSSMECRAKPNTWHTQDSHSCVRPEVEVREGALTLGGVGVAQLDPEAFRGESVCSARGWASDHMAGPEPLLQLLPSHSVLDR